MRHLLSAIAAAVLGLAATASAQNVSGEYLLKAEGQTVLALRLRQTGDGPITGTVSTPGETLPIAPTLAEGRLSFVTASESGDTMYWLAEPKPMGLSVLIASRGTDGTPDFTGAQRHLLSRSLGGGQGMLGKSAKWLTTIAGVAESVILLCDQTGVREEGACRAALGVIRQIAPALMVARLASGGSTATLARALRPTDGVAVGQAAGLADVGGTSSGQAPAEASALLRIAGGQATPSEPMVAARRPDVGADHVLLEHGSQTIGVRFTDAGDGTITGTVTLGWTALQLNGRRAGDDVEFVISAAGSAVGSARGRLQGDELTLSFTSGGASETHTLLRRGIGWSDASALAERWRAALSGRELTLAAGSATGASAGMAPQVTLAFCAGGRLLGRGAEAEAAEGSWRVITQGPLVALEISGDAGPMQIGLRAGPGDALYVSEQPAQLTQGASCE
jgi:hypothetical protein